MASNVPLLDEQDFNVPSLLQPLENQDINAANNFCWYFHSSQFFEPQCNNSAILTAHVNDPAANYILHSRKEFEQRLKTIGGGTQFVVAGEPQGEGGGQPWLYQRQNIVRNAEGQLEMFVEGNWYNQGTRILMAPSMLDVVRARLVGTCSYAPSTSS
jgi:mediator of RNA polymerase II transcription subunit 6